MMRTLKALVNAVSGLTAEILARAKPLTPVFG